MLETCSPLGLRAEVAISPGVGSPPRVPALDGLRGVAIGLIMILHLYVRAPTPPGSQLHESLKTLFSLSFCGVDLFFVLSGFLIAGILLDQRGAPNLLRVFYVRRAFRILPLYALLLASFFAAREIPSFARTNLGMYFHSDVPLWSYFVFLQNATMAAARDLGAYWLTPTWSLAVEEQFYLLMPLAVLRCSRPQLVWLCTGLVLLAPCGRMLALLLAGNGFAAMFLLPMRADALLLGVLVAVLVRSPAATESVRRHRPLLGAVTSGLVVACIVLSLGNPSADSWLMASLGYTLVGLCGASVLLWTLIAPGSTVARALTWRPLRALGLVSYFVYLFHQPVWFALHWLLRGSSPRHLTPDAWAVTALAAVVTCALAAASWRWFERPLLSLGHRFVFRSITS